MSDKKDRKYSRRKRTIFARSRATLLQHSCGDDIRNCYSQSYPSEGNARFCLRQSYRYDDFLQCCDYRICRSDGSPQHCKPGWLVQCNIHLKNVVQPYRTAEKSDMC